MYSIGLYTGESKEKQIKKMNGMSLYYTFIQNLVLIRKTNFATTIAFKIKINPDCK